MGSLFLGQSYLELSLAFDVSSLIAMAVDDIKPVLSAKFPRKTASPHLYLLLQGFSSSPENKNKQRNKTQQV